MRCYAVQPFSERSDESLYAEFRRDLVEIVTSLLTLEARRPLVFISLQQIVDKLEARPQLAGFLLCEAVGERPAPLKSRGMDALSPQPFLLGQGVEVWTLQVMDAFGALAQEDG